LPGRKSGAANWAEQAYRRMLDGDEAWRAILEIATNDELPPFVRRSPNWTLTVSAGDVWNVEPVASVETDLLLALYLPYCTTLRRGFVVGHLGQSLDGRIATREGASRWVTGAADIAHNHRMRALSDAVVIGASTLLHDDPQLTVRRCTGRNPVRVVVDSNRTLADGYGLFRDGAAQSLVFVADDKACPGEFLGAAEIVPLPRRGASVSPGEVIAELARRGLTRIFIEGGGVTVSRFLAADCLDRLQITVSPLIIGSGRPSITLPEIADLRHGLRPKMRRFDLGEDIMFECLLRD
jgi:diaminohydroxyphosphoribosylaminopyrimidine deaminase/5-amino-6-(5-phosphoribosylamino)uracil reductase